MTISELIAWRSRAAARSGTPE
ncbi:GpE family phage tail protein [Dickeya solani]|nr:GpE family phage tail protein [Dickeya solani]MDV7006499.1 GpE family phage tail protein [Dickeya solani]